MKQPVLSSAASRPRTTTTTFSVTFCALVPLLLVAGVLIIGSVPRASDADAVYMAITRGDADGLRDLIAQHPNLDARDHLGYTPLALAVLSGRNDMVEMLLARGVAVDVAHPGLGTPLMLALGNGHADVARTLMERGADVHVQCQGWDPMSNAVRSTNLACFELALDAGAKLVVAGRSCSLLTLASFDNDTRLLRRLLDAGVDPNVPDPDGTTPLNNAIECGATESVRLLLMSGADPSRANADGSTAHGLASRGQFVEVLALLNEHNGTDPEREAARPISPIGGVVRSP